MTNSTLGGLLKDYRLQKGKSQLDIAFSLGWKETSRLSRIEQGKTETPARELIDKIIEVIGLEEEEKNTLLLTGGYLPTAKEIKRVVQETEPIRQGWPYPCTLYDFTWRIIKKNAQNIRVYQLSEDLINKIDKNHLRILDQIFLLPIENYKILEDKNPKKFHAFLRTVVSQFKYEHSHRTNEKWYIEHIKKLMDSKLFREIWSTINIKFTGNDVVNKFAIEIIVNPEDSRKLLNFYLFVVPVIKDPRFEIELMVPADLETYQFFQ